MLEPVNRDWKSKIDSLNPQPDAPGKQGPADYCLLVVIGRWYEVIDATSAGSTTETSLEG